MKKTKSFIRFWGFTIAEVIINLGIIGIIAQMILPSVIQNAEKQTITAGIKKFIAEFESGYKQILINNHCDTIKCTGLYDETVNPVAFEQNYTAELKKVFSVLEVCTKDSTCSFTWIPERRIGGGGLWGAQPAIDFGPLYKLKSGAIIQPRGGYTNTTTSSKIKWFGNFYIDVNGTKRPNVYGKDIHWVHLSDQGVFFPDYGKDYCEARYSVPYTSCSEYWKLNGSCNPSVISSPGDGCLARIMENSFTFDFW